MVIILHVLFHNVSYDEGWSIPIAQHGMAYSFFGKQRIPSERLSGGLYPHIPYIFKSHIYIYIINDKFTETKTFTPA